MPVTHADPERLPRPGKCSEANCSDDVAPYSGRGRPPTRCPAHVVLRRKYRTNWENRRTATFLRAPT